MGNVKPRIIDLLRLLEEIAPSTISEDWDNPGLQVGSLHQEIGRILLSLDPTLESTREAGRRQAQVLLTHHPLLFKPISCLNEDIYPGNVIREAMIGGISIIAVHTNLDAAAKGINNILADVLTLKDVAPLREIPEIPGGGLGRIGSLPEPMGMAPFLKKLKVALSAERVRIIGERASPIRRVAIMGGAGGSMISRASEMGADVFITGDVTYHQALEAKTLGLLLIDAGHFCTERTAFLHFAKSLRQVLQEKGFEAEVEVYGDEKDPFSHA
jgi:dinuclear metal center YbgI/SA1388 family protein